MLVGKEHNRNQNNFISSKSELENEYIFFFSWYIELKALSVLCGLNNNWETMN